MAIPLIYSYMATFDVYYSDVTILMHLLAVSNRQVADVEGGRILLENRA